MHLEIRTGSDSLRRELTKVVTSVGSDDAADFCLSSLPRHWGVIKRKNDSLEIRVLASGANHTLELGESLEADGVTIRWGGASERLPVERLALTLSHADAPDAALQGLLRELLDITDASGGAFVLRDGANYMVPIAENRDGSPLGEGADLLSDTLVRDVLERGEPICVADAPAHDRYGQVPSVAALRLRSVLCVPMKLGNQTLGALFLGQRDASFSTEQMEDLQVVCSMVLPLLAQLRRSASSGGAAEFLLVGEHESMGEVRRLVERVGPSTLSVLVLGDTGTGKEMVARAIHHASSRRDQEMVALNCSAVPESLLGAELFGAKKGAYTGAIADRKGVVERADGSTLFLDEVGDMPPAMQASLLRVLEERKVTRLGDGEARSVDFRLVAATHKDLEAEVEAGHFRQDLLFRLKELTIVLPSLAERGEDVLLLAHLFLRQAERELGLVPHQISAGAERALLAHGWPGNIRELKSTMRRAALLCDTEAILPVDLQLSAPRTSSQRGSQAPPELELPLSDARERFVSDYATRVLAKHEGNREAAAAALGISLRTLYRILG